jgi:NAD(P)-dependent dehydrogenase (short-subunit alcohol dehydrogenase family)
MPGAGWSPPRPRGWGGVNILVICASIQPRTPFLEVTGDEIQRQFQINFRATVELLQAALPAMKANGWGRVLTVGSINQVRPEPDLAIYAALKSAQHNLCVNLAKQYAPFDVMINNLSPGLVATERNRWRRQDAEVWRNIRIDRTALRQRANPPLARLSWRSGPVYFSQLPIGYAGAEALLPVLCRQKRSRYFWASPFVPRGNDLSRNLRSLTGACNCMRCLDFPGQTMSP